MFNAIDINERIKSDFGCQEPEVLEIFSDAFSKAEYLNHNRIIRCVIFLADGSIDSLKKYIEKAIYDPRDVMLWSEYENQRQDEHPKRVRDFNKPFDPSHKTV